MGRNAIIHARVREIHGEDSAIVGGAVWLTGSQRFLTEEEAAAVTPTAAEDAERTIAAEVDARIEAQARALGYNSAAHLAGYATSTVPEWAAEAAMFVAWRDLVWVTVFAARAEAVVGGQVPTLDAVLAALPKWPHKS
jgi:hypothetical protein